MSKNARRPQASKVRQKTDLSLAQQTIQQDCLTGQPSYSYSIARALTREGGTIVECQTCDWYHVQKEGP